MASARHPAGKQLSKEAVFLGPATTRGLLYDVGVWPALIATLDERRTVHGELHRLKCPTRTLAWLDEYEGIVRGNVIPEYERGLCRVVFGRNSPIQAWVYYYQWPLDGARPVPSGRWRRSAISGGRRVPPQDLLRLKKQ